MAEPYKGGWVQQQQRLRDAFARERMGDWHIDQQCDVRNKAGSARCPETARFVVTHEGDQSYVCPSCLGPQLLNDG